jgi:alpha-D-ribose 1-methylphosphonate 5-triphosphate synthase subunit PhnL
MSTREAAPPMIEVRSLAKTFVLHTRGGATIPVFAAVDLDVAAGECVVLAGPSGIGKSTLLRSLYANYRPQAGAVRIRHDGAWVDLTAAPPPVVLAVRRRTLGYVSQFLRVIPRVSTRNLVMEPLLALGVAADDAARRAETMLDRLNIPPSLWNLPPATFSGGEQQRVNLARVFVVEYPIYLLDEPTASLDSDNRRIVAELIGAARDRGAAIVGIFHDAAVRAVVATRVIDLGQWRKAA